MQRVEVLLAHSKKWGTTIESVTGLSLSRYSDGIFDKFVAYGHDFAIQVLDDKQFHLFDPMVSDRSCQLRAIWLPCFWQFKKKEVDLTDEERFIFGLARFLSEAVVKFDHPMTGTCPLKTRMLTEKDDVFGIGNAEARRKFLGVAKAIFAKRVLDDLEKWWISFVEPSSQVTGFFQADAVALYLETLRFFAEPAETVYSDVRVPVIHFFASFLVLMSLAAHFDIPFLAVFRQAFRDSEGYFRVRDSAVQRFRYQSSQRCFCPVAHDAPVESCPAIVFSGHSYLEGTRQIDPQSMIDSLNEYGHQKGTFLDYVYAIMSTHEFVPGDGASLDEVYRVAPEFARMITAYREFAEKANVFCSVTATSIYEAIQTQTLNSVHIEQCAYEIVHTCNGEFSEVDHR